jgi:hypothetical protein
MSEKSQFETAEVQLGDGGTDGRADFRVVECRDQSVCIEYDSDGVQHWLQDNRLVRRDGDLVVV